MIKITFLLLIFLLQIYKLGSVSAYDNPKYANFDAFPNPQSDDFRRCNIPRRDFLCDPEDILGGGSYLSESVLEVIESFPNKTRNQFGKTECERKGVNLGIGLSHDFRNEIAAAFATKWFQPQKSNCSKYIMIMLVETYSYHPNVYGISYSNNLPISNQQIAVLLGKIKPHGYVYDELGRLIEGLLQIIQYDMDSTDFLILSDLEQPMPHLKQSNSKPFVVSAWLSTGIAVCCSLMVSALMFTLYWAFCGKKPVDGRVSFNPLENELEGQSKK